MPNNLLTRWSSDHQKSISVHFQERPLDWLRDELASVGCTFFSNDPVLCHEFGLLVPEDDETRRLRRKQMDNALLEAFQSGNHVFYMVHGEHSATSFRFTDTARPLPRFSDAWIAGFVIVNRQQWRTYHQCAARSVVSKWLSEKAQYVEHELNGWLYEYWYQDQQQGDSYVSDGYLSPEEALTAALSEYPECCHTKDDFITSYALRGA